MVSFRAQLNSGSPCSNRLDFTPAVLSYIYIKFPALLLRLVLFLLSCYSACVVEDSLGG